MRKKSKPVAKKKSDVLATKTNKAEISERVTVVMDCLVAGMRALDIQKLVSKNPELNWGVSMRTIETYMSRANRQIAKIQEGMREAEFNKALLRLTMIYNKAFQIQDYKTALAAQKSINELLGLNSPVKIDVKDTRISSVKIEIVNGISSKGI